MFSDSLLAFTFLFVAGTALPGTFIQARAAPAVTGQPAASAWRPGGPSSPVYVAYTGDGSSSHGWPSRENWTTFDDIWSLNLSNMKASCTNIAKLRENDNSDQELIDLKDSIIEVAGDSKVDARFILAIVLQESGGCVRIQTTGNGVRNPGLMQSHNGASCNDGTLVSPCPKTTILQMIQDGTVGTDFGDGLVQCINKQSVGSIDNDATQSYFRAARQYNSGSIAHLDDLNDANGATASYCRDVANRATGWH